MAEFGYTKVEDRTKQKKAINVTDTYWADSVYGALGSDKITVQGAWVGVDDIQTFAGNDVVKVLDNAEKVNIYTHEGNDKVNIGNKTANITIETGFQTETGKSKIKDNDTITIGAHSKDITIVSDA